ncbi:hypothetical protein LMG28138_02438 [Pararobbsia alpina]|uniref:Uncharacterized protein n=1 Tax=Pararobbsia alpina TaxID=621374 RepID=A0A6S7CT53_9BURK|nr:hypothetical protein LMG28138_02438 [Pararobbsia alpina]
MASPITSLTGAADRLYDGGPARDRKPAQATRADRAPPRCRYAAPSIHSQ